MKTRTPLVATSLLFCLLISLATHAQQVVTIPAGPPATTPTPPPIPPEQKAYDEARRIKEPQKKIEALEKVIKDYPERFVAFQARNEILDALIKNFPDQKEHIHTAAEKILEPTQGVVFSNSFTTLTVASKLMEAGLFLD